MGAYHAKSGPKESAFNEDPPPMIRLTKQTDYGIVLLTHLAQDPARHANAPELAAETGLPLPTVSKILKLLARGDLLSSHRGVKGGYCLGRLPSQITVAEVITALEGPIAMTECVEHSPGLCIQEPVCPNRSNWQILNEVVRQALSQVTLADMTRPLVARERLVSLGSGRVEPFAPPVA
jgi:FeS assembly SUF system regulator